MQENDSAFMDDDSWKIKYIPAEFKGLISFKTRRDYINDVVKFKVDTPIRVYIAYEATNVSPVDSTWKVSNYEMAFLKINSNDTKKLESGSLVVATEDVSLNIAYKDFSGGEIKFNTFAPQPTKLILFISPGQKGPNLTCGGNEIELTKDTL